LHRQPILFFINSVELRSVVLDPGFTLSWTIINNQTITCNFTWEQSGLQAGWLGLAWHDLGDPSSAMATTDQVIAIWDKTGKGTIDDRFATMHMPPPTDVSLGGKNDILTYKIILTSTAVSAIFSRKLVTGDQYDFALQEGPTKLVYAFGQGVFEYHGENKGFAALDFFDDYCGNQQTCANCLKSTACVYCTDDSLCYNKDRVGQCSDVTTTCPPEPKIRKP